MKKQYSAGSLVLAVGIVTAAITLLVTSIKKEGETTRLATTGDGMEIEEVLRAEGLLVSVMKNQLTRECFTVVSSQTIARAWLVSLTPSRCGMSRMDPLMRVGQSLHDLKTGLRIWVIENLDTGQCFTVIRRDGVAIAPSQCAPKPK